MITNLKNNMDFMTFVKNRQDRVNTYLDHILPNSLLVPTHLHEAMRYSVLNGGKRIRPLLVYATGEALGVTPDLLDIPASAIELIHAYSLVHDDLPAMDNDDLRRGRPTCHKAFDEATAILVGDALQSLAFGVLANDSKELTPQTRIAMMSCLARASGSQGMAGGQALDLKATGQLLNPDQLETIHHLKTGALISACIQLGALSCTSLSDAIINAITDFGNFVGLCFQIQDDILDATGNTHLLGKTVGSDQTKQKATFITMKGVEESKMRLAICYQEAINALQPLGNSAKTLRCLADYIITRDH